MGGRQNPVSVCGQMADLESEVRLGSGTELEMLLSHTGKRHGARCGDWKQSGGSGDRSMLLCHMEAKGPSGILG